MSSRPFRAEGLADVPFARKSPLALLGLDDEQRTDVDLEFAGFGWSELRRVALADDRDRRELEDALVLALHTPDEPDPGDALELAFWIGDDVELRVPWLAFADVHVRPLLRAEHRDVVLALCNPQHRAIERPAWLGDRHLHWADGDVTSWLDPDGSIRLQATRWHCR